MVSKTIRIVKREARRPGWVTFVTVFCTITQTLMTLHGGIR